MTKHVSKSEKLANEIDATCAFFKKLPKAKAKALEALLDSMSSETFRQFHETEFESFISGDLANDLEETGQTATDPALAECAREITMYRLARALAPMFR